MAMITSPNVSAMPTWPSAPVFSLTMIAPAPAKTSAKVPIASAATAGASGTDFMQLVRRGCAVVGLVRRVERALELVDELARDSERLFLDRVVDPRPLAPRRDQSGAAEGA